MTYVSIASYPHLVGFSVSHPRVVFTDATSSRGRRKDAHSIVTIMANYYLHNFFSLLLNTE